MVSRRRPVVSRRRRPMVFPPMRRPMVSRRRRPVVMFPWRRPMVALRHLLALFRHVAAKALRHLLA